MGREYSNRRLQEQMKENTGGRVVPGRLRGMKRMENANGMWLMLEYFGLQEAWNMEAARFGRKGRNLFISTTYQAYGLRLGVKTFNAMHYSTGRLFCICNPQVIDAGEECKIIWENNSEGNIARRDDRLRILVMRESNPDCAVEIKGLTATRGSKYVVFSPRTEPSFSGKTHLYIFFQSADGKMFSPDEHVVLE